MTNIKSILSKNYEHIINNCLTGISIVDCETNKFIYANDEFCETVEYSQEELFSMEIEDVTHPSDQKFDSYSIDNLMDKKIDSFVTTKRYISKTGKVIWVKIRIATFPTENIISILNINTVKIEDNRMEILLEKTMEMMNSFSLSVKKQDEILSFLKSRERILLEILKFIKKNWVSIAIVLFVISLGLGSHSIKSLVEAIR